MSEENKKLTEEELEQVSGGNLESIPGMRYDVSLGRWVEDGPQSIPPCPGVVIGR